MRMSKQHSSVSLSLRSIALFAVFSSLASAQYGQFKYCCYIQKCLNVTAVCADNPVCAATCLTSSNSSSSTKPRLICQAPTVESASYSCFTPFLLPSEPNSSSSFSATASASSDTPPPSLINQICGQTYDPAIPPAPQALINYGHCRTDCPGWDLLAPDSFSLSSSVALLMQYIVPVVVFCTTTPRRQRWNVPDWIFHVSSGPIWLRVPRAVLGFLLGAMIIVGDMVVWVFTVFVGAGPILVGGIVEGWSDFEIMRTLEENTVQLLVNQRIELIAALLCGNLDLKVVEARKVINEALIVPNEEPAVLNHDQRDRYLQRTQAQLKSILRAQSTFGSLIGGPVIFFVSAFALTLEALSNNIGDNKTAHNLAFGMWWTLVVQVAIISSCMLASNNPATVAGIVASNSILDPASPSWRRTSAATLHGQNIPHDRHIPGMSPIFESPFMPVTLWDRGKVKRAWLREGEAWAQSERLREMVELRRKRWFVGWVVIPGLAFTLIFVPTSMAFMISYTTPKVCIACRASVFLMYTVCQSVLIIANTWWTYYPDIFWNWLSTLDSSPRQTRVPKSRAYLRAALRALGQVILRFLVAVTLLVSSFGSLFTSFVGTILELLGAFGNCLCSIPVGAWSSPNRDMETFNLALDTAEHREKSKYWSAGGYAIIAFMLVVTYAGWWYQKWLRKRLVSVIDSLSNVEK